MAETIILEVNVQQSIEQLAIITREINALKEERKKFQAEAAKGDLEAQKNIERLNVTIKQSTEDYKAQQRVLDGYTKATKLNADTVNFQNNSINTNRNLLKQLTAQYNELKNPSKEATDTIKRLSDTLKVQEGAIGDNRRSVGSYRESIVAAAKDISLFGVNVGGIIDPLKNASAGFKAAGGGIGGLASGLTTLAIGVLPIAITGVTTFLNTFEDGAESLERGLSGLRGASQFVAGSIADLGKSIFDTFGDAAQKPILENVKSLGESIRDRFAASAEGAKEVIGGFGKLLKGEFEEAGKAIVSGTIQYSTFGIVSTKALKDFADGASAAAKQASEFTRQLQEIEEQERESAVITSANQVVIDKLLASSRNRSKTEEERLDILRRASELERTNLALEQKGAQERLSIVKQQTDIKRQQGIVTEKVTADELNAIKKVDDLNRASLSLQEKIANREAQIFDALEKRREKELADLNKLADARRKAEIEFARATGANVDESLFFLEEAGRKRVAVFELEFEDRRELLRASGVAETEITKLYESEKTAIVQDEVNKQNAIIQSGINRDKIALALLKTNAIQQLELQKLTGETQAQIDQEFAESSFATFSEYYAAKKKLYEEDVKASALASQQGISIFNSAASFLQQGLTQIANGIAQATEENIASLQEQLDSGIITQEKFDTRTRELKLQAFKETKAINIVSATIQTAQAVLSAYTSGLQAGGPAGPAVGAVFAAIAAGIGAAQISAIASQEPPKFALGGEVEVGGKLHSQGGTIYRGSDGNVFEAERGEGIFVMKRDAYQDIAKLSAFNMAYGGNSWLGSSTRYAEQGGLITDGGFFVREIAQQQQSQAFIENAIRRGFAFAPQPVVSVQEIDTVRLSAERSKIVAEG